MTTDIRTTQLVQLKLMKKLHQVCIENGIKYIMIAGTLLGAVRHKGFIPWDDDLDIALTRSDYEKLVRILREKPIEGYFLQSFETGPHYVQPYAKLRKDGTKFVESWFQGINMHEGIFIDIFPFDKISAPKSKSTKLRMALARMLTFSIWRKEKCHLKRNGLKKIEPVVSSIIGILPKKTIISIQNALVDRENKNWAYVASMLDSNYPLEKTCFQREDFEDAILMDFEDTQFYGPRKWDKFLTRLYRNYMELPPEDKRNSGHAVVELKY